MTHCDVCMKANQADLQPVLLHDLEGEAEVGVVCRTCRNILDLPVMATAQVEAGAGDRQPSVYQLGLFSGGVP